MSSRPELKLDWCSHAAAKYAVEHWHYSGCLPVTKCNYLGCWEGQKFIGCIVWSLGSGPQLGASYGLSLGEYAELARVALREHLFPVTMMVSTAISILKHKYPKMRLGISFADTNEGHVGAIYQAGNWLYTGITGKATLYKFNGRWVHARTLGVQWGKKRNPNVRAGLETKIVEGKHRYLYPLDKAMRRQIEALRQPYPKRVTSIGSDAPAVQAGEPGARPRVALHG